MISWYNNLSFRYKIPLRAVIFLLVSAALFTLAFIWLAHDRLKEETSQSARMIHDFLSHNLVPFIIQDDPMQAYENVRNIARQQQDEIEAIIVLLPNQHIYVSSLPLKYPMLTPIQLEWNLESLNLNQLQKTKQGIRYVSNLEYDDTLIARLVILYKPSLFTQRYWQVIKRSLIIAALILLILLPISIYWGRRMAEPLTKLAACLHELPNGNYRALSHDTFYYSKDEIGQLSQAITTMFEQLTQAEAVKRQLAVSEKLAALGRLSAGIAHEINNPLGGMLNAIDTHRVHGSQDARTLKTLSLLERGLLQIRDIVSALLIEVKPQQAVFSQHDIDDIETLLHNKILAKSIQLVWQTNLTDHSHRIGATYLRQVLLNLLLNAIDASYPNQKIHIELTISETELKLSVTNRGQTINEKQLAQLFEPHISFKTQGNGLGLWITYQLIQQMEGKIQVTSHDSQTRFYISIPNNVTEE